MYSSYTMKKRRASFFCVALYLLASLCLLEENVETLSFVSNTHGEGGFFTLPWRASSGRKERFGRKILSQSAGEVSSHLKPLHLLKIQFGPDYNLSADQIVSIYMREIHGSGILPDKKRQMYYIRPTEDRKLKKKFHEARFKQQKYMQRLRKECLHPAGVGGGGGGGSGEMPTSSMPDSYLKLMDIAIDLYNEKIAEMEQKSAEKA